MSCGAWVSFATTGLSWIVRVACASLPEGSSTWTSTWFGPGFYGHRMACGGKLTTTTLGVANRNLPCGTPVQVFFRGRSITVPVVDRGPFANGASYDLTAATAQALGITETTRIGVIPRPQAATAKRGKRH